MKSSPIDWEFSEGSGSFDGVVAQNGFGAPPPLTGASDRRARGRKDQHIHPLERNTVTGRDDGAFGFCSEVLVCRDRRDAARVLGDRRPVIDEMRDRQPGGDRRHVVHVIQIVMRDDQEIELLHPCRPGRFFHPYRISVVETRETGVDQHALP